MYCFENRALLTLVVHLFVPYIYCADDKAKYEIPDVSIEVYSPKGFEASIPDAPGITHFALEGTVTSRLSQKAISISGDVARPSNGTWVYEDPALELSKGDLINYFVTVAVGNDGYLKDNLNYTVTELGSNPNSDTSQQECKPSATIIANKPACAGQVIFEDHFNTLQEDLWQIEHKIPIDHPEYPFISYQKLRNQDPTIWVEDGFLKIKPRLQQTIKGFSNNTIYTGILDLYSSCTGTAQSCYIQASGANILPPVVSARVTSKRVHFKYGTVDVRAKLPQGDWIYPEILLEPFLMRYGTLPFSSGILKIACARGNKVLLSGSTSYSNEVLYGGGIVSPKCNEAFLVEKRKDDQKMWGDEFHTYSMRWAPGKVDRYSYERAVTVSDKITLSVDGEEWGRIEPSASGLTGSLPSTCKASSDMWSQGGIMAPFDEEFYLAIGVAVGGVTEFKDGLVTASGRPKPWRNQASKARLNFWNDLNAWYPSWSKPEMLVDFVKVVAL